MKDYYRILGVNRDATDSEMKKAFRRLAMKYHPDRNPENKDAEDKFKEINEAYACLSDPEKRSNYDRFGSADGMGGGGAGYGPFNSNFSDIFEDIFGDFFGTFAGQGRARATRGADLRYDLTLSLEEAVRGVEKELKLPSWEICGVCEGSGAKPGHGPVTCPDCNGAGQRRFQQGFFSVTRTCSRCGGTGQFITTPCSECDGDGRVRKFRVLSVKVPPGVDSGSRLRMSGEGEPGTNGGPPGDLYIVITVKPHKFFKREGLNLYCDVPVSFTQAVLGAEIEVPTLYGNEKIKIPPHTPSGKEFVLKGRGVPKLGGHSKGNQIVRIYIDVPKKLTKRQKELLEEFASLSGDEVQSGFMEKLKEFFS
ncbi:MAG: molecular chaperone DnaJ [Nitrospirae bacterium]|nr:molecular chaperone DnaJ [Nitrospirota bacterium]